MPSPAELDKIQKDYLSDEQIGKDKIREESFDAGRKKGQDEITAKIEEVELKNKLLDKYYKPYRREVSERASREENPDVSEERDRALYGLLEEVGLEEDFKAIRKIYGFFYGPAILTPGELPNIEKELVLKVLEKLPVHLYEIESGDPEKILAEEVLKELINNHPEFSNFRFSSHTTKEIRDYLLSYLGINRDDFKSKMEEERESDWTEGKTVTNLIRHRVLEK